jgi:membrane protein
VAVVVGIALFWWGLRFLLGGLVSYLAAVPGAVATIVGLGGLRVFSGLVFEPLIASNAVGYGALGTVLILESWLIGVGWVVYGAQLFGRWFHDAWLRAWAHSRRGHRKPGGGGQKGEQGPRVQAHRPGSRQRRRPQVWFGGANPLPSGLRALSADVRHRGHEWKPRRRC